MQKSFSAGGVVLNPSGQVLVVNQDGVSWSLPKGHIDAGEDARQAAEREIREESGISKLEFVQELGSYERYKIGKGGVGEDTTDLKHITFFLFTTKQLDFAPEDPRHPEARWLAPNEAVALLTHPKDKAFFESVLPQIEAFVQR